MGDELAGFLKALPWRREDWNAITKKEIRARNATHPTTLPSCRKPAACPMATMDASAAVPLPCWMAGCRRT